MRIGLWNGGTGEAFDTHGVPLGRFSNHAEAKKAMWAATLPSDFWYRTELAPIPLLQQLNEWVIARNEKRLPKWKFRFAADRAVQIQPKITRAHPILFECVALQTSDLTAKLFTEPASLDNHPHPYWRINFRLYGDDQNTGRWWLKPASVKRGKLCPASGLVELRQRLQEELRPNRFALTNDFMLSSSCLCCGKALTDPTSQARWIGPECWGNASTDIPRILMATRSEGEAA
jgi:hypothetical protein